MPKETLNPEGLYNTGRYSHVVRFGDLVFLAGQTAHDGNGNMVGKGDIEAQAVRVFENIRIALASVGGTMDDILQMRTYITDLAYREPVGRVRARYFQALPPASTLLVVKGLASPDYMLEVEVVAAVERR